MSTRCFHQFFISPLHSATIKWTQVFFQHGLGSFFAFDGTQDLLLDRFALDVVLCLESMATPFALDFLGKDLPEGLFISYHLSETLVWGQVGNEHPGHGLRVMLKLKLFFLLNLFKYGRLFVFIYIFKFCSEVVESQSIGFVLYGWNCCLLAWVDLLLDYVTVFLLKGVELLEEIYLHRLDVEQLRLERQLPRPAHQPELVVLSSFGFRAVVIFVRLQGPKEDAWFDLVPSQSFKEPTVILSQKGTERFFSVFPIDPF